MKLHWAAAQNLAEGPAVAAKPIVDGPADIIICSPNLSKAQNLDIIPPVLGMVQTNEHR